jgi:FkbM family methyltransferase
LYIRFKLLERPTLKLPELERSVAFRKGMQERHAFAQVFIHREYDFDWGSDLERIVDAGANVGMATLYFKQRFPEAHIAAVEPHPGNAEAFRGNTSHLGGVELFEAALHSRSGETLAVTDEGHGSNAFMTRADGGEQAVAEVATVTLSDLMQRMGWPSVDLVKIDIEGGEGVLFEASLDWMDVTRHIVLEFHERMVAGSSAPVLQAMAAKGFLVADVRGENVLFSRTGE